MEIKVIQQGAFLMYQRYPEISLAKHEENVRMVLEGISEHLVLRCLYDAAVRELQRARGVE